MTEQEKEVKTAPQDPTPTEPQPEAQESVESASNSKAYNFRNLRKKLSAAEEEKKRDKERISELEKKVAEATKQSLEKDFHKQLLPNMEIEGAAEDYASLGQLTKVQEAAAEKQAKALAALASSKVDPEQLAAKVEQLAEERVNSLFRKREYEENEAYLANSVGKERITKEISNNQVLKDLLSTLDEYEQLAYLRNYMENKLQAEKFTSSDNVGRGGYNFTGVSDSNVSGNTTRPSYSGNGISLKEAMANNWEGLANFMQRGRTR
jgi:hypothetical protein